MEQNINDIKREIDRILPEIIGIRRDIHMHPELSEHEERTCGLICDKLASIGVDYTGHVAGHGVCATIYGADRSHGVAVRADMDALPLTEAVDVPFKSVNSGVMHACGHDVHTGILLGTAMVLQNMKDRLPGSVRLLFQPSEETIGGAKQMIDEGCLRNPDIRSVIGLHVDSGTNAGSAEFIPGSMNAASCEFFVKVTGKSCHGAHPTSGIDPLIPACEMVTALQSVITRKVNPAEGALITVGQFNSGTKNNIIPGETEFSGIIRTLDLANRDVIKRAVETMCLGIAQSHGASCDVIFRDSYPSLENDDDLLDMIRPVAEAVLGSEKVSVSKRPSLGADDFAYFCHGTRGLYFNIGVRRPDETAAYPIHSEKFNPDEGCIKTGILLEVTAVLKILDEESKE